MASIGLGIVGAVIGGSIGGPTGASIGWSIGALIGNLLDPPKIKGPELSDLKLQTSSYGTPIKIVYGTMRIAGTVDWIGNDGNMVPHKQKSGGKGGPEVESTTYTASWSMKYCNTELVSIDKWWCDGRVVREGDEESDDWPVTTYLGTATQLPDPTIEADKGAGEVPGNRGYAYDVLTDCQMEQFFNRLPQTEVLARTVELPAIPIERIAENYDMDTDYVDGVRITQWTRNGAEIRAIHSYPGGPLREIWQLGSNLSTYDRAMLYTGDSTPAGDPSPHHFQLCNPTLAPGNQYPTYAIGIYKTSIGETALWVRWQYVGVGDVGIAAGSGNVYFPVLVTVDYHNYQVGGNPNANVPEGIEMGTIYGLPTGVWIAGGVLSEDRTKLYLFTTPTKAGDIDTWYEIIDGDIARTGTVNLSPTIDRFCFGNSSPDFGINTSPGMFENNGRYCWVYNTDGTGPLADQVGGYVSIYEIDPDTLEFALNTFYGIADVDGPADAAGSDVGSLQVLKTGYAGIIRGDGRLAIFRRVGGPDGVTLASIVLDLSLRSGMTADQVDVSQLESTIVHGYVIGAQMQTRNAIEMLRQAYFFDAVESDTSVRFVMRGGASVATIDDDDLGAHEFGSDPPPLLAVTRIQEAELPQSVTVQYINPLIDYQVSTQTASRLVTSSISVTSIQLNIAMGDDEARAIANRHLFAAWFEREHFTWTTSRKYAYLEPTDVVTIQGRLIRITSKTETPIGVITWEGVLSAPYFASDGDYIIGAPSNGFTPTVPPGERPLTAAYLLDMPVLSQLDSPFGFKWAAAPASAGPWTGAALFKSTDNEVTWNVVATTNTVDAMGTVAEALGPVAGSPIDTLTVTLIDGDVELDSSPTGFLFALQAGLKWEICRSYTATLIAPGQYTITVDERGLLGSDVYAADHATGDRFVRLPVTDVDAPESELNVPLKYKAVTFGKTIASAAVIEFTNTGESTDEFYDVELRNLDTFVGACGSPFRGKKGLVPAPDEADCGADKFLSAEGDWRVVPGSGGGSPGAVGGQIETLENGALVDANAQALDFTAGILATNAGYGVTAISVPTFVGLAGSPPTGSVAGLVPAAGGTDGGEFLRSDGTWADVSPLTTKGDIHTFSTVDARLPVGSNTQVLSAASGETTGLKWVNANATGGVAYADRVVAAGGETTITLSVPADVDLTIRIQCRDSASVTGQNQYMYFNADTTAANYDNSQYSRVLSGAGSVSTVAATTAGMWIGVTPGVLNNANAVASYVIFINNYSGTTFHKNVHSQCTARYQTTPTRDVLFVDGLWKSTAAITSITFTAPSGGWVAGSTFTAYVSP